MRRSYLQQWWLLARLRLDRLKLANRVCVAKRRLRGTGGNLGGLAVLPLAVEHVELGAEEVFAAREVVADGNANGEVGVAECSVDVRDELVLVDRNGQDLTLAVEPHDASVGRLLRRDEDRLGRHLNQVSACVSARVSVSE